MFLRKNTASQTVCFGLVNASSGAALTGATVSVRRCIDGTFAAATGTVTEDSGGLYKFAPSQADTNGDQIGYYFTATNAIPVCLNVRTTAADMADTVRFGLTALPNVASGSAGAIITSGTGTAQLSTSSGLVTLAGVTHTGAVIPTVTTTATATNLTNLPSIPANWLTAAGIAASALNGKGDWNVGKTGYSLTATTGLGNQTANITGNLSGSVGSIGSGGITSGSFAAGAINAAAIAADAIGASELAADAVAEIADAVWDEAISGHLTGGTTGNALNAAGAAGDPWSTTLPGAYSAGSAGYILGNNLDAAVSTRSTYAGGDTSGTTTLLSRLSSTRAGYLDNLSGGAVALASGVTVTTNNDKTGYSLTQSFPANFASMAITAGGAVTAGTVSDKTGYSLSSSQTFNVTGNITGNLSGSVGSVTGAVGSVTGNVGGNVAGSVGSVTGAVGSVTAAVSVNLSQTLSAARNVSAVADTSLTLNDAFHLAIAGAAGQETVVGTTYTVKSPSTATVLRIFTLDSGTAPTSRT